MRSDIAKKLVERPRYGGGGKYNLRSDRRKGKNPEMWDNLPQKESCKKVNIRHFQGKYLNEYFPPLEGFLRKNVGRPWDKVNSEIRALLSPCSTTQKHVLDHLYRDFVETSPIWIDGKPHASNFGYDGKPYPIREGRFYVDTHGLLKAAKKAKKLPRYKPEARKSINDYEEYRQINGLWFWVRYTHLFPGQTGFDVVLGKEFKVGEWGNYELSRSNGAPLQGRQLLGSSTTLRGGVRLAVEKRQVSKRTIRDEGLNKL
jgi:hypothetical protein